MSCPDDERVLDSLSNQTKRWFRDLVQNLAAEHDVGGPDISRVVESSYKVTAIRLIHQRALAAIAAHETVIPLPILNECCRLAAEELVRIRQIRDAHEKGNLPTESLRQLPSYAPYRRYFDEDPELLLDGLMSALANQRSQSSNSVSPVQAAVERSTAPVGTSRELPNLSRTDRAWLEAQILGCAVADDVSGKRFRAGFKKEYLENTALRLRKLMLRAFTIGELSIAQQDVAAISRQAAEEVYRLRKLKAELVAGRLSRRALKKRTVYGKYAGYFDDTSAPSTVSALAAEIARELDTNRNSRTN
jgi:hypothetical protein